MSSKDQESVGIQLPKPMARRKQVITLAKLYGATEHQILIQLLEDRSRYEELFNKFASHNEPWRALKLRRAVERYAHRITALDSRLKELRERKSTRLFLQDFLLELRKLIPSPPGQEPVISIRQYGSNKDGWQSRLGVTVFHETTGRVFWLEDQDFLRTPEDLAESVRKLWSGETETLNDQSTAS
jgi:hypothetical protein